MGDTATYDDKLRALETDRARHMPPGLLLHRSDTARRQIRPQANLQESPSYACSTPSSCSGKARILDRKINVTELALLFNGGKESGPEAPAKKAFD